MRGAELKRSMRHVFACSCSVALWLCGCNERAEREQPPSLSRSPLVPASTEISVPWRANFAGAPPLRRSPDALSVGDLDFARAAIFAEGRTPPAFTALKMDGQIVLRSSGKATPGETELLESLGFKLDQTNKDEYVRYVALTERAAFEQELQSRIAHAETEAKESRLRVEASRSPVAAGATQAGHLVYTGQPLDI